MYNDKTIENVINLIKSDKYKNSYDVYNRSNINNYYFYTQEYVFNNNKKPKEISEAFNYEIDNVKKTCRKQRNIGENCINDYYCNNNLGCDQKTMKCIPYYSLEVGASIKMPENNVFSLCKSGESINNVCVETFIENEGDKDCSKYGKCYYKLSNSDVKIGMENKCFCKKDNSQKKLCEKGSQDINKKNYYSLLSEVLNNSIKSCHTSERSNCLVSYNYEFKNLEVSSKLYYYKFKAFFMELYNYNDYLNDNLELNEKNLLYNNKKISVKCVLNFDFPELTNKFIKPQICNQCPVFKCINNNTQLTSDSKNKVCLQKKTEKGIIHNYLDYCGNKDYSCLFDKNILFDEKSEDTIIRCNKYSFVENNQSQEVEDESNKKNESNYSASTTIYPDNRYPGEPCLSDKDCINLSCNKNYICSGSEVNQKCKSHFDCIAGLYCSKQNICIKQSYTGDFCNSEYECRNNLVCYENKCITYFSLKTGTYIDINKPPYNLMDNPSELCEFNYIDIHSKECSYFKLPQKNIENVNKNFKEISSDELLKCNIKEKCRYINHKGNYVFYDCICGYNSKGYSYCPNSHDNQYIWDLYFNQIRINRNNICHTMNRRNCPFIPKAFKVLEQTYKKQTYLKGFINGAEPCVIKQLFEYDISSFLLHINNISSCILAAILLIMLI